MTVCIAALADDGKSLILASDREITHGFPINTEIESDDKKIHQVSDKIFLLFAGDSFVGSQLINEIKKEKQGAVTVREVAEAVREKYVKMRTARMTELHIEPRGFSLEEYKINQRNMDDQIVLTIDNRISQDVQSFQLALIVAGIDDSGGHVYGIFHPGILNLMDVSGFCTIGIGDVHATNALIANRYSSKFTLREVLYLVYDAKKKSEVAPGVGKLTDMSYVTIDENVHDLTDTEIKELDQIRENLGKKIEKELKKALDSYKLSGKMKVENGNGSKSK